MRKFFIIAFTACLLILGTSFGAAHGLEKPAHEILGIAEPTLLPDSPFYFFKNLGRGFRLFLTFDPVKKAELELHFADEKLAEATKIAEKPDVAKETLASALENYIDAQRRLKTRLESLRDTNKNVDELLEKLAGRVLDHAKLFNALGDDFEKEDLDKVSGEIAKGVKKALELDGKKFKEKLKEKIKEDRDDDAEDFDVLEDLKEIDEELEEELEDLDEDLKDMEENAREREKEQGERMRQGPSSETIRPKTVRVEIKNFKFEGDEIRIPAGSIVIWANKDSVRHDATSDTGKFGSELLSKDETFEYTFAEKGVFPYHCTPHPNMKGKIIVD